MTKTFYSRDEVGKFTGKYGKTWFQRVTYRVKQVAKATIFALGVISLTGWAILSGTHLGTPITQASGLVDISEKNFKEKIDSLKNDVVAQIQSCESGGKKEADGLIVFDTNNKASIGTLQFQITTVQHYYKVLYNQTITRKEAIEIALNDEKAMKLGKDIMFRTSNMAGKDWVNCSRKHSSDEQIKLIKKLES